MTETLGRPSVAPAVRRAKNPTWLGRRPRKALLVLHIASSGVWLGLDAVMAVLIVTSVVTDDDRTRGVCYQALELVTVWPMTVAGLTCLVTGVLLGLGTTYGLVRSWWVLIKLGLNLVLSTLVLVLLRPGMDDLAERGARLLDGQAAVTAVGDLKFPPIVSSTALLVAVVLSVFKPWGRVRRSRSSRPEPARPAS